MDKRQAKRQVCEMVARDLIAQLEAKELGQALDGEDRERIEGAAIDLADELLRRAGVRRDAGVVDDRQLSIFDALVG